MTTTRKQREVNFGLLVRITEALEDPELARLWDEHTWDDERLWRQQETESIGRKGKGGEGRVFASENIGEWDIVRSSPRGIRDALGEDEKDGEPQVRVSRLSDRPDVREGLRSNPPDRKGHNSIERWARNGFVSPGCFDKPDEELLDPSYDSYEYAGGRRPGTFFRLTARRTLREEAEWQSVRMPREPLSYKLSTGSSGEEGDDPGRLVRRGQSVRLPWGGNPFEDTTEREVIPEEEEPNPAAEAVRRALADLLPADQEVYRLVYEEGLTQEAAAERLPYSRPMVQKRLRRIHQKMKAALSDGGIKRG